MHVLILGGTRDAMNLADLLLAAPQFTATYSLAGRTRRPLPAALPTRRGGFGGVSGLQQWLSAHHVAAVVDATHPFAAQMSAHALQACRALGLPLVRFGREPWVAGDGDNWQHCASLSAAAQRLISHGQPGQRILLATGGSTLHHFDHIHDRHFAVRCVDPPQPPPRFSSWSLIEDRGPFQLDDERRLLREQRIDTIVCKNSGGKAAQAKLLAARELGIEVIMVERPDIAPADAELFDSPSVLQWLQTRLATALSSQ
ncbi:cobalt-precorrin-6A reductase [Spongiibacter sp.]|uniref:cobalt-precorrin-6A reductase n=1 Tax=Spongiibacter sp. TaxID=2024860 RepID=UPI0035691674